VPVVVVVVVVAAAAVVVAVAAVVALLFVAAFVIDLVGQEPEIGVSFGFPQELVVSFLAAALVAAVVVELSL